MKKTLTLIALALAPLLSTGCSSTGYDDPDMVETLTIDFGSTDLQLMAASMSDSLIGAPGLSYLDTSGKGEDKRIIVYMGGVENRTSEHIDTSGITDKLRTSLLKSGKFRFVSGAAGQAEIGDQVSFQQGSGRVDPAMAKAFGKQLGADVIVYGTLRSINKKKGSSIETLGAKNEDLFFQFSMQCDNITTAEVIWAEEKDIRKRERTGIFGR